MRVKKYWSLYLNLENIKSVQGTIKKFETENEEIDDPIKINKEFFFGNLV